VTRLAQRVFNTEASGIRRIFDLAANLRDPVNLSIGQPDFDVPEPLRERAVSAIRAGRNAYTQTQGGRELRAALLAGPLKDYGEREVLVTGAVSGGLILAYMALLNPGDEIMLPDPYFVMYKQLALMFDAKPIFYDCYPDWRFDGERLAAGITTRCKAILIGSPANPTGAVHSREELAAAARLAERHDLAILADETYESYCYEGPPARMREFCPRRTVTLGGFSKSHAMTGWRVGWAAGPEDLIQAMTKFQQFSFVCAPSPLQIGAAAAIGFDMSGRIGEYRAKRDLIYRGLVDAGFEVVRPGGAFYIFPRAPRGTGGEFAEECVRNNLLVIPGNCFSERDTHFRISYAARDETIRRGLRILGELAGRG
jgi:aspartate aminotransferase/aminotransferase